MIIDCFMQISKLTFRLLALFLTSVPFIAECQSENPSKESLFWSSFIYDWNFVDSWLVEMEIDYNQLISGSPDWKSVAIQPSIEHYPSGAIDLFCGANFSWTLQTSDVLTKEIMPFMGFRWNISRPENRFFFRMEEKLEYRYFKNDDGSNTHSGRLKSRAELIVSITQKNLDQYKNLFGIFKLDSYAYFNRELKERYQSSLMFHIGCGYRFNYKNQVNVEYIYQLSRNSLEESITQNRSNIIYFTYNRYL